MRPSVQAGSLLSAAHMLYTRVVLHVGLLVDATNAVQLPKPAQVAELAPPSAASKNGCTGMELGVAPAQTSVDVRERLGEALTVERGHEGHGVHIDLLELIAEERPM